MSQAHPPEQSVPEAVNSQMEVPQQRPDGKGYIDDAAEPCDNKSEGSSVEESLDSADERSHGGWPEDESGLEDDEEYDDDNWDVENEDWELADGDFTKQYNRVRQAYTAAGGGTQPLPARNSHAPGAIKAAPAKAGSLGKKLVNPALLGGVGHNPKSAAERQNQKDKADRATHEQVLDDRTRNTLLRLVNRGYFGVIEGCVSTGKEANVYLAFPGSDTPSEPYPYPPAIAVKIYRTAILNFRSRQKYIVGEHRFAGGYSSARNARKMVSLWAEKELRNLRRLVAGGVRAPIVIEQRDNVLVMEFLGREGVASPRLKDADISNSKLARLYGEVLVAMRRMYHDCQLVHADLSEYNILYHDSHLYIIDVSQSVEHDHPNAFDFLRSDIRNVEDFFTKRSGGAVKTLGLRRAWSFIVDENVGLSRDDQAGDAGEDRLLDVLREWLDREPEEEEAEEETDDAKAKAEVDDAVFFSSYIPRSLGEVYDPERDIDILKAGKGDTLIYAGITKLDINEGKAASEGEMASNEGETPAPIKEEEADASQEVEASPDAEEPTAPEGTAERRPSKSVRWADWEPEEEAEVDAAEFEKKSRGFRHEDKESKKERKKALKEENREKRKHKMPKGEKARLVKKTSSR
ncbi:hypothetical protein CcaverHIS002_0206600 [Cutaneotrichosporon cavernicola]|uniref:Serine/threonine-protein kinase RIO1 n=1 Tax=Cutaneotrichosporon cavernicola TaxID=279322 RepID=A0AA48IDW6_9TREE|nr:uncharacterized protein CcaverHIS019_0206580 [Cutaneotrichosporon cavernicola]BEI81500.1 hypothetical protein CcaverHIS002_0206600 [Cutaneotrichosporon cavernicola]BEI89296.1 hypothetical protein CcaverHIS019_0206580 [Cutaneotrichosporon cavernicola]BEI97072.1 hypothetical protein CcaverHIS631_0206610 [Cutaneotrichosporon cavernicola]BEJ04845.1 hypothetical protein CcaverHIS641_0206620 [Cutaneotrichosporon cavernicola]